MKPLASAMRYGPFLAGHWKYLVSAEPGLKQSGSAPGPATISGPAACAMVENANAVASMAPMLAKRRNCDVGFISFSPIGLHCLIFRSENSLIFCLQWTRYFYLYQVCFS